MAPGDHSKPQVSIYDEVAFPSYSYPQSHPERLATMARLCGFVPAPLAGCRVLELGCGAGGNLLPMAVGLPQSEFVGVDLSAQQIALGRDDIASVGIGNVRLKACDILSLDASLGQFDYLIAHGVYSWTTDAVRQKILALCQELLSPHGVAYINYNTYPGWHVQGMLRDMLYFHSQPFTDPAERVREARRMIEFLRQTLPAPSTPFGGLVRAELEAIQRNSDSFLFHAYLNVVNQPIYLSEFQSHATAHGLAYLGDAEPEATWPERATPPMAAPVKQLTPDESRWSQYFDFIRFRTSRRSLLCRQGFSIERGPYLAAMQEFHVSAPLRRAESEQPAGTSTFVTLAGRSVSTNEPRMRATLQLLADVWPASIPFRQLAESLDAEAAALPSGGFHSVASWQQDLVHGFCNHVLNLSVQPSRCSRSIGHRPQTSPLARLQASRGDFVANWQHEIVRLNDSDRRCLGLLDGTRTLKEISQQFGSQTDESLARLSASGLLCDA